MKRKPRTMPRKGFYVLRSDAYPVLYERGWREVIYTTGQRGGGGHKYCRQGTSQVPIPSQWATLLWSCVPGVADLAAKYDFHETLPDPEAIDFPDMPPFPSEES
jgi:hypothetical protein